MYNALETLTVYQELERELMKAPAPLSASGCMESQKMTLAAQLAKWQNVAIAIAGQNNPDLAQQLAVLAAGQMQQVNQRTGMPNGANLTEDDKLNVPADPGPVPE